MICKIESTDFFIHRGNETIRVAVVRTDRGQYQAEFPTKLQPNRVNKLIGLKYADIVRTELQNVIGMTLEETGQSTEFQRNLVTYAVKDTNAQCYDLSGAISADQMRVLDELSLSEVLYCPTCDIMCKNARTCIRNRANW